MGLLGIALEQITGERYETLIDQLICAPLGLQHTRLVPLPEEQVAAGSGRLGQRLLPGSYGALAGASDLRSCASDLTRFTRLAFGEDREELVHAAPISLSVRFPVGDGSEQALGWRIWRLRGDEWPGHGGESPGYRASISIHPPSQVAIVALASGRNGSHSWFDDLVPELWKTLRPS